MPCLSDTCSRHKRDSRDEGEEGRGEAACAVSVPDGEEWRKCSRGLGRGDVRAVCVCTFQWRVMHVH